MGFIEVEVRFLINIFIELILGYAVFYILSNLILIPGKHKIQHVTNKDNYTSAKKEINKARKWLCLGWTLIILGINCIIYFL